MWFRQSSIEIKASLKYGLLLWGDSWEKFWGSLRKKSSFAKMERNKGGYSTKTGIKRVEPGPGNRKSLRRGQIPGPSTSWSLRQRGIGKPASACDQLLPWRAWIGQVWFFFKAWMFGCQSDHRSNEGVSEEGGRTGETQRQLCRCCLCTGSVLPARLPWARWMSSCTRWVSWVCQVSPMFQENASFVSGVSLIWVWLSLAGEPPLPARCLLDQCWPEIQIFITVWVLTTLPCPGLLLQFPARWGSVTSTLEAEEALQCLILCQV